MQTMARESWTDDKLDLLNERVDLRFDAVDRQFAEVDRRLDKIDRRLDRIDQKLGKVDERFDTLIAEMKAGFEGVNARFESFYRLLMYAFVSFATLMLAAVAIVANLPR